MFNTCQYQKKYVDLILTNAIIYTVDDQFSQVSAIAVKDGKFVAVGDDFEILEKYDSKIIIDAQKQPIYPAFLDGHCHFTGMGNLLLRYVNLNNCRSFDDVLERLQKHSESHSSDWILGQGWDQNLWEDKSFPTNEKLSQLFPNKKIVLARIDGHVGLVSDNVLQMANFTNAPLLKGGEIVVNKKGKPTGILLDNAYDSVRAIIPELSHEEQVQALLEAQKICFECGLAGITDAGLSLSQILLIDSLQKQNELKIKVNAMMNPDDGTMEYFIKNGIIVKDRLSIRSVKLYADGSLGSRGAKLLKPYSDMPETSGLMIADSDYYYRIYEKAYQSGIQVCTHAIGDEAVRRVLQGYAAILKGKNDFRWRIEHSQVVHPDDFKMYRDFSIIPSIQSTHATSDMFWAGDRLGNERMKTAYAQKQLLEQNRWLINGTDFPIEQVNPLYTFYAAVERKNLDGQPFEGFQTENALSRQEALRSITCWVAKGYFEENRKGSIEVGKDADFVILSDDIMTIEGDKIPSVVVKKLFVSGEKVFER